jgi:hypothetical protein
MPIVNRMGYRRPRTSPRTAFVWGLALGVSAVIVLAWRGVRRAGEDEQPRWDAETARTIAMGALLADPQLRRYALQVRAITPDILDVSGTVDTAEDAERAMAAVREASGGRTVLDRIDVDGHGVRGNAVAGTDTQR